MKKRGKQDADRAKSSSKKTWRQILRHGKYKNYNNKRPNE